MLRGFAHPGETANNLNSPFLLTSCKTPQKTC